MQGVRNDAEDIGIFIEWRDSTGLGKFHKNIYRDPVDNAPYNKSELSPKEKGHVYRYRMTKDGAVIYMPMRVMDEETAAVVTQFASLAAVPPWFKEPPPKTKRVRLPYYIWQHFSLNAEDFSAFKVEAERLEWEVIRGFFDVTALADELDKLHYRMNKWLEEYKRLIALTLPGATISDAQKESIWNVLSWLEETLGDLQIARKQFAVNIITWKAELPPGDQMHILPILHKIEAINIEMNNCNLAELYAKLTNALAGMVNNNPADADTLYRTLEDLKKVYPILRIISFDKIMHTLTVTAAGGELVYDGKNVIVVSQFQTAETASAGTKTNQLTKVRKLL
jgi:heme-degrading monooxygenase HmoA